MQAQSQQINEYEDIQSWLEINIRASEPNPQFNASFVLTSDYFYASIEVGKPSFFALNPLKLCTFTFFT